MNFWALNCLFDYFSANPWKKDGKDEFNFACFIQKYKLLHCYTFLIINKTMSIRLSYNGVENG